MCRFFVSLLHCSKSAMKFAFHGAVRGWAKSASDKKGVHNEGYHARGAKTLTRGWLPRSCRRARTDIAQPNGDVGPRDGLARRRPRVLVAERRDGDVREVS